MSENKKLNDMETENVAGGSTGMIPNLNFKVDIPVESYVLIKDTEAVCRECGKKYFLNLMMPKSYGDFSLCPECNRKKD